MSSAIITSGLEKSFNNAKALNSIDIEVKRGELFGLIGPDGAGKTTLIRILATLMLPDSGSAQVLGEDVVKNYKNLRKKIGYMPGRFSLYQDLSVEENLSLFAAIHNTTIEQNYHLIKDIYAQIEPFKHRKAGALSGGMKQKLALSCAMIHEPELLFLDEPTTGVDAVSRNEFWEMLDKLKERNISILVSTPYMDEAELCDRVALIQKGTILKIDTPAAIVANFGKKIFAVKSQNKIKLLNDLEQYEFASTVNAFGGFLHYTDVREDFEVSEVINYLKDNNHQEIVMKTIAPEIEDCFMALMDNN